MSDFKLGGQHVPWPLAIAAITYFETEENDVVEVLEPLLTSHPEISQGTATNVFRAMIQGKNPIRALRKLREADRESIQGFVSAVEATKKKMQEERC